MCFNYVKTSVAVSTTILTKVVFTGFFYIYVYCIWLERLYVDFINI